MLFMRTISSVWFLPVLMLAWATPAMTAEPPAPIDHIEIALDRKTLELVREPGATAEITLTAVGPDGQRRLLDPAAATLTATTTEASGGVEVVTIEQGKIVPRDGGIAKITATVEQDGTKHSASTDLVVAPFYRDYHQCLVTKLFMGMEGTPVERLAKDRQSHPWDSQDHLPRRLAEGGPRPWLSGLGRGQPAAEAAPRRHGA